MIDILCTIHFIVLAWQQVAQSTFQNCSVKSGHEEKNEEGSDVTEVGGSGNGDITQDEDWFWLGASTAVLDFDAYVSVDQELAMCDVLCIEEMGGVVGSGSCVDDDDGGGGVQTIAEFYRSTSCVESIRAFMYAHDITKRDQVNIVNIERLLFSLKRKGATEQMMINDFIKNK
jgi:hypothetical protein